MDQITDFALRRRDGKIIREGMTQAQIAQLGTSTLEAVTWRNGPRNVSVALTPGSLAELVPGRRHVAIIMRAEGTPPSLLVMDQNGQLVRKVSNTQVVNGKPVMGEFAWFETLAPEQEDFFCAVFYLPRGVTYRLKVDAASDNTVQLGETR